MNSKEAHYNLLGDFSNEFAT